ncbi:cytochrome P450 [Nocardia sp. NPDC051321]|uniref:cytochrome P450 n=1 Tax=Nocardia sp. NPDC051321 TaxID=3364323 RepID=UPI00378BF284
MSGRHDHRLVGPRAVSTLIDLGFAPIAAGVIARRRPMMAVLERVQADARAVRRMRQLRRAHGRGPVELVLPGRRIIVVIDPDDVGAVLEQSPFPFHPANREKRAALRHFQPHAVLASEGSIRAERRTLNETALATGQPLHHLAEPFTAVIAEEARALTTTALRHGRLDAAQFTIEWWRLVRRLVLGDQARFDDTITDQLWKLRSAANWSFLGFPHPRLREKFTERLYDYAETASPETLLGALTKTPATGAADPIGQVPHWLFAFDAAGIALTRTLALLATHPEQRARALAEAGDLGNPALRPYLRACMLESVRLWPTTPTILRDTTEDTQWRCGEERFTIDGGAAVLIAVPAFHRDEQLLPFAHDFTPDIWLDGRAEQYPQLVPFSAGPAECPGRNLVLFVTSTLLAQLIGNADFTLRSTPAPTPGRPLPVTFNNFGLDFGVAAPRSTVGPQSAGGGPSAEMPRSSA